MEERICQWIADHRDDLFACLEVLVNTDSNSHDKAGVDRVGEIMAGHLRRIGCHVERHAREKVGDCLVATLPGGKAGRIMLSGHMDTALPVGDAQRRPFKIEGKRAYGPGVADMKGGLTTMLFAMEALHTICPDEMMDMAAVLTGDEEIGSFASHDLLRNEGEKATAVFCMESGRANGAIVSARRGFGFYELEVFGRSAHAGVDPENGLSAIDELARKVVALQDLNDLERGIAVNVNHIKGGAPGLTIPDYAWASLSAGLQYDRWRTGHGQGGRSPQLSCLGPHRAARRAGLWPMEKTRRCKTAGRGAKAGQVIGRGGGYSHRWLC